MLCEIPLKAVDVPITGAWHREVVTRKNITRASVSCNWDDSFFNLFTGINWSASLLPASAGHCFPKTLSALHPVERHSETLLLRELECFRQARVVNEHVGMDS